MNNNRKNAQMLAKSLSDFIDAGLSHATTDIDKLFLLTALALHIDMRSKELSGEQPCEQKTEPKKWDKRDKKRMKKAMQKN